MIPLLKVDYFRIKPMPWKVFQQSLALTNSGEHRTRSFQNSVIMPSVAIAPKWGDSAFELYSLPSGDPFRRHTRKNDAC